MKKVLYCLVIALLAVNSAFAFTATDWMTFDEVNTGVISDYAGNGFAFDPTGAETYAPEAYFYSDNVNGWIYDEGENIYTVFTGFDKFSTEGIELTSDDRFVRLSASFNSAEKDGSGESKYWGYANYAKPWTGEGEYVFTPADLEYSYYSSYYDGQQFIPWDGEGAEVTYTSVSFLADGYYGSGDCYLFLTDDTKGTFRFGRDNTVVPEPATYAYALMGLASAFGLKRRIKK